MSRPTAPDGAASGWVLRLVTAARRSPGLVSHLTIAALLAIILGIGIRTGIVPMRSYFEDVIFFADNAWRVLWGQRPHVDYSSGLGPVTYLLSALGIRLAGGNLNGLGYGNALAGVAIGIWAYALLVRRVSGLLAVAGAAMIVIGLVSGMKYSTGGDASACRTASFAGRKRSFLESLKPLARSRIALWRR